MAVPTVNTPPVLLDNVSVDRGGVRVLENVSFAAGPGTLVGVVGPNGSGKSTLFNAMAGLIPYEEGSISIYGKPPGEARGHIAYVPQRESVNWRFPVTVSDVVMLGRTRQIGWLRNPRKKDREIIQQCLDRVGMWHRRSALMTELSGGQRQRVFVARALAQEAEILLLDEAFSGVDVASQESLVAILRDLRDEGTTILLVTHDLTGMAQRLDACLCLNRHVCCYGPPEEAFTPEVLQELYGPHGLNSLNVERVHDGHLH